MIDLIIHHRQNKTAFNADGFNCHTIIFKIIWTKCNIFWNAVLTIDWITIKYNNNSSTKNVRCRKYITILYIFVSHSLFHVRNLSFVLSVLLFEIQYLLTTKINSFLKFLRVWFNMNLAPYLCEGGWPQFE